jgi:SAM-dependent methyltransferase
MHQSSMQKMSAFVSTYLAGHVDNELEIVDFGSQEVDGQENSSYRNLFTNPRWRYRGLDIEPGANVHLVVEDAFNWSQLEDDSVDLVVSGQALEHVDYFWVSIFEIARVLRPGGVAALIAPSAGPEHRYPLDCWRFYTDGFRALSDYIGFEVLDCYTDWDRATWADSMLVMRKPLWDAQERLRFRQQLAHQKAALSPESFQEPLFDVEIPATSVLASLTGGRLTPILDSFRVEDEEPPLKSRLRSACKEVLGRTGQKRLRSLLQR